MASHTILLVQSTPKADSRTWSDYDSMDMCLEAVCRIFEEHLKSIRHGEDLSYDVYDFFQFLDQLGDLSCMVLDPVRQVYLPRPRDWIKGQLFKMLQRQAGR